MDPDDFLDAAVVSEDQIMDWNIHNDHADDYDEDYYRSLDGDEI